MSATNQTPALHLPKFLDGDKPTWTGDFNGAMDKIDNGHVELASDLATAQATILTLQTSLASALTRITALENA